MVSRYKVPRKLYPFSSTPLGRTILLLINILADEFIDKEAAASRKYRQTGLTDKILMLRLLNYVPWFKEEYFQKIGKELGANIIYDRFHKSRHNAGAKGQSTKESYGREYALKNPKLAPHYDAVYKLFIRGHLISREEAFLAGGGNGRT